MKIMSKREKERDDEIKKGYLNSNRQCKPLRTKSHEVKCGSAVRLTGSSYRSTTNQPPEASYLR